MTPRGAKSGDHSHPDGRSILRCRFSSIHLSGLPSFQLCLITWCFRPLVFTPLSLKHSGLITSNEHHDSCSNSPTSQDWKESIVSHAAVNKSMDTERRSVLVLFHWFSGCIVSRFYFIFFLGFQKSSGFVPAGICWARRSRFANAAHLACFTSTRSADCAALSTRCRTCPQHHGCHEGQGPSMALQWISACWKTMSSGNTLDLWIQIFHPCPDWHWWYEV